MGLRQSSWLLAILAHTTSIYGVELCGLSQPDSMKTCISVRLPWQEDPIYHCIDKEKFKYRNGCQNRGLLECVNQGRTDTLMIATPWDCCPLTSVPDHCMHHQCNPKPFNRTCMEYETNDMMSQPSFGYVYNDICCPKYFCEEGTTPKDCHFKQLQPGCLNPPKNKMNCIGFRDSYGCCIKYQCDGDGKPGMCPMEAMANKYQMGPDSMHANKTNEGEPEPEPQAENNNKNEVKAGGGFYQPSKIGSPYGGPVARPGYSIITNGNAMVACVGDHNCPGKMKCCADDINVYSDGRFFPKNPGPVSGFCMEPYKGK